MQLQNILIAAVAATGAMAMPTARDIKTDVTNGAPFQLMALLGTVNPFQMGFFMAARSSILLNLPQPNATCKAPSDGIAQFYLNNGTMFLYSTDNPPQKLFTDRSGMGQGVFGYVTGAQGTVRNAETTGWGVDESGTLGLGGAGFIACPNSIDGAWSIWVAAGREQPAQNQGCVGVSARVVPVVNPNSCLYTS